MTVTYSPPISKPADAKTRSLRRIAYFGAAPDTANLGVSALCISVLQELLRNEPETRITVFDYGRGRRSESIRVGDKKIQFDRVGAKLSRRYWQRETFWNIRWSNRLGGLANDAVKALREADVVFDISGGDSFTDLYGPRRFESVCAAKELVLEMGRPLVLLPQTYGPFSAARARQRASEIVRRSTMAWARDERSLETLKELAGSDFDPERHRSGVDVAFALETLPPSTSLSDPIATWLSNERKAQTIGFNVSGLIWHDPTAMRERYGFKADYREVVLGFLRRVLVQSDANILLIPHVMTPPGHYESDPGANDAVIAALHYDKDARVQQAAETRVTRIPAGTTDPREMKWIISRCDWFCGTRMHSCIAGLSSGVPTAAIAYSVKTLGVFDTCLAGANVVDPRQLDTVNSADALWVRWREQSCAPAKCRGALDAVLQARQFATILQSVLCISAQGSLTTGGASLEP